MEKQARFKESLWEFFKFAVIAALIVVPVRLWIAQPFIVSGASMSPNFENGEYLVVDEFSYHFREPQRGEVIIFRYPQDPSKFFIKRVIGLPNEEIKINDGQIYIHNNKFPQGMLIEESYLKNNDQITNLEITLKEKEYFVLGDNRQVSSDSRAWGALPANLIIGRAWVRLWPFNKLTISF
ncbi:signal peptidase I [Patescibacteria group bacterium]|nr:signal peptidase I [Patescibacteria group bacterium]